MTKRRLRPLGDVKIGTTVWVKGQMHSKDARTAYVSFESGDGFGFDAKTFAETEDRVQDAVELIEGCIATDKFIEPVSDALAVLVSAVKEARKA